MAETHSRRPAGARNGETPISSDTINRPVAQPFDHAIDLDLTPISRAGRRGSDMDSFALRSEQTQDLDGLGAGTATAMRHTRIKLRDFTRPEYQIVVPENQPEATTQDVHPAVAVMDPLFRKACVRAAGYDLFIDLQPTRMTGQWNERHPMPHERSLVNAWIAGFGSVNEIV